LSDDLDTLLPGLVPNGGAITVRHLLQQTTGLFDYTEDQRMWRPYLRGNLGYAWTPPRLLRLANSHEPHFAPGARWEYSNTNYLLLGLIVQRVTGNPLQAELASRLFRPLGLHGTTFDTRPQMAVPHAHGYTRIGKRVLDVTGQSLTWGWAAGAMTSTAADVARFYRALLRGALLPAHLLQAMETTVDAGANSEQYGFALWRTKTLALDPHAQLSCSLVWGHNGGLPGWDAEAFSSLNGRRQVVVLSNTDVGSLSPAGARALLHVVETAYCG
jgi:D-alanyl-D-alanine carboxypeptidase